MQIFACTESMRLWHVLGHVHISSWLFPYARATGGAQVTPSPGRLPEVSAAHTSLVWSAAPRFFAISFAFFCVLLVFSFVFSAHYLRRFEFSAIVCIVWDGCQADLDSKISDFSNILPKGTSAL